MEAANEEEKKILYGTSTSIKIKAKLPPNRNLQAPQDGGQSPQMQIQARPLAKQEKGEEME